MRICFIVIAIFLMSSLYSQSTHIVQRGETFELIAKRYDISVSDIKAKNPLVDECYAGLTLSIPSSSESAKEYNDALIYDLKGNVKQCIIYVKDNAFGNEDFEVYLTHEFGADGRVIHGEGFFIKRDRKNRIVQTKNRVDFDLFMGFLNSHKFICVDYVYDMYGKVKSEVCWSLEDGIANPIYSSELLYFYNSNGYVVKEIDKDLHKETKRIDLVREYEYLSFDENGNWTERKYVDPRQESEVVQRRVITYY